MLEQQRNIAQTKSDELARQLQSARQEDQKLYAIVEGEGLSVRVAKALLRNPDVRQAPGKAQVNQGLHHSKDFVRSLAEALQRNKNLNGTFISITTSAYKSLLRGSAELIFDAEKCRYALNVYDEQDEGFGAEIVLSAGEYWEAVVQAKCLVAVLRPLKGFIFKIKIAAPPTRLT
ncbi:hypothetical protein [Pseudomonas sp. TMP25]|uniref:hypothetical protein n=1 Tax=Pseudomonas sp. TMP25 TaxID=3136561 RepID=UPI003101996A